MSDLVDDLLVDRFFRRVGNRDVQTITLHHE
jgi:hypothetical protein